MVINHGPLRLGIVGYGIGGKYFHAPFVLAADGVDLVGVVARSAAKKAEVEGDLPGVAIYDDLTALLAAGVDAVTITTPPETRRALVLQALAAGVHVVADNPFAPDAAGGVELAEAAEAAGLDLSVYHNRRFDADVQTLSAVLATGELGDVWRVHSRFDLDDPATLAAGPAGGLLRDVGAHVIDQMLWLLGDVSEVWADLDDVTLPEGVTDASFMVVLKHASGVKSYISSCKVNHLWSRQLRAYGSLGSFESNGTDVQANALFHGRRPVDDPGAWGFEEESRWGVLHTAAGDRPVASERGHYSDFYEAFARAVRGDGPAPSNAREGVRTLAVLDAAGRSAVGGGWERP